MDDDDLQLSSSTLDALKAFMSERDEQQKRFEELKAAAEDQHDQKSQRIVTMEDFEEDWQQSQFWYDDATATKLAEELLDGVEDGALVGLVSAPSVYVKINQLKATGKVSKDIRVKLLEYDTRFGIFGDEFIFYDFAQPLKGLPAELKGKFERVLVDPPFLSDDCQTKTALTVRWMTKPWKAATTTTTTSGNTGSEGSAKIMLCTGERMRELVERLYRQAGLRATGFEVVHKKGLSNEFRCYSTWESERVRFAQDGEP
ncbi:putative N6-adenine methyltransferase-domain-containing protein [Geopyxis carbonaria]|nr:putative N6-adenine methyltransferase-domain-containing protein [Geopyxis carbonaria]